MLNEEFIQLLSQNKINKLQSYLNKNKNQLEVLKDETSFLDSPSISERLYCLKYGIKQRLVCENGNPLKYIKFGQGYSEFCNNPVNCDCKKTKVRDKKIKTNLKKYGTEWPSQSKEVQEKYRKTNLEKYGVSNWAKTTDSKNIKINFWKNISHDAKFKISTKRQITNLKKYGVLNPSQIETVKQKKKRTTLKNHGVEFFKQKNIKKETLAILNDEKEFKNIVNEKTIKDIKTILDIDSTTITNYCHRYDCRNLIKNDRSSRLEDMVKKICMDYQIKLIHNDRKIIYPMELDFYFPTIQVAIECHGLFWHSQLRGGKDANYHFKKWESCRSQGITLYQYFEDEFENSLELIKSKILYLNNKCQGRILGARRMEVNWLKNTQEEFDFYNKNHIQGPRLDRTFTVGGWITPNILSACMSVKINKDQNQMEIVRFSTDISNRYPGAFTKILTWIIKQLQFKGEVLSWSDNRHSNGHLYQANGFAAVQNQGPGYFVTDYQSRWRREHFMKAKIKQRHPDVDLSKTEWQLEQELGYDRIWDAGKILWKKLI
jgi:hypothetical protein